MRTRWPIPNHSRARAGDALAALGDPRFDPQRSYLPADEMLGFVHVAADPDFRIGTRKVDEKRVIVLADTLLFDETNDALSPTSEFYIARYPVTIRQFKAFVDATGFQLGNAGVLRDPGSRPVYFVSWYEALAYCSWLQEMLATSPALQGSPIARLIREQVSRVTLPTELEWEKAARGGLRDKVFSWGDTPDPNRANCSKSRIFDMSAVACFPPNGFGLCDMIGNVSEWTSSHYKPYPYLADDGREDLNSEVDRVVRGGSFGMNPGSARCAYRYRVQPKFHHSDLGFRVVLRSPPGPS